MAILAVLQHIFSSNGPRNMILGSMPMFLGTRNRMELFWKVSSQQYCQICTAGLPEKQKDCDTRKHKPVTSGDSYIPPEHCFVPKWPNMRFWARQTPIWAISVQNIGPRQKLSIKKFTLGLMNIFCIKHFSLKSIF